MKGKIRVAAIGLSALECIAFKSIVHASARVEIDTFSSFSEFKVFADSFNSFITTAECFLINSKFFMPRKSSTIIVVQKDDRYLNTELKGSDIEAITYSSDEAEIEARVQRLINRDLPEMHTSAELSAREREVLKELSAGLTNKEIGERLNISVNTVITHRKNISAKLGIRSASGLSLYALLNGLL